MTVNVDDVNETPIPMLVDAAFISEAAEVGDFVVAGESEALYLQGYDDDNDPLSFTITTPSVPFEISPIADTDNAVNIKLTAPLNYEAKSAYPITVKVSDGTSMATTSFTIAVPASLFAWMSGCLTQVLDLCGLCGVFAGRGCERRAGACRQDMLHA